ncbi:hypothetical protein T11_3528 [Trichinella zimbabwensis]|uniref:Uncharacterized protein n=1 Tax=Trichinella zimbabwensis TaxID=268475 RepID=A0A0V1GXC8_9BILA|nr:hypothetical protein T11_3528 [Trichinella zimbabwensis]
MDEAKETTDDKTPTALHHQQQQQRQHSFPCTVPDRENQELHVAAFKHPFAAKHHCQMKRHAECWRATIKDDNLTALYQENMVGVAELPNRTSESELLSDEHCPIEQADRDIEIRSLLLDFQVQWEAFAESFHSTTELNII